MSRKNFRSKILCKFVQQDHRTYKGKKNTYACTPHTKRTHIFSHIQTHSAPFHPLSLHRTAYSFVGISDDFVSNSATNVTEEQVCELQALCCLVLGSSVSGTLYHFFFPPSVILWHPLLLFGPSFFFEL